ncbi:MAG: VWA domain-containing protein [Nitrospirota bacterium]|jgi:Ca-activated chloride channel family protein
MAENLNLNYTLSKECLPVSGESQLLYTLIEIGAGQIGAATKGMPFNLALLLDRSGSMDGRKIENLREAVKNVVDSLSEKDRISIVIFDDEVEVLLSNQAPTDKAGIKNKIDDIIPRGGTQISDGLKKAIEEIKKGASKDMVSRILLLTDGETWDDEKKCEELSAEAKKAGVSITAVGLGDEWNENLLISIGEKSGGDSYWIEKPEDIMARFTSEVAGLRDVVATNLNVIYKLSKGVEPLRIYRVKPMISDLGRSVVGSGNISVSLGEVDGAVGQSLLVETILPSKDAGRFRVGQIEISYDVPSKGIRQEKIKADVVLNFSADQALTAKVNAKVMNVVERVNAFKLQTRALTEARLGNTIAATKKLQVAATRLLELGEVELAKTAKMEAENLAKGGSLTSAGTKKLQYETRRLTRKLLDEIEAGK